MNKFNGYTVVIAKPVKVSSIRSWKERLFTRPWKPLTKRNYSLCEVLEDGKVITYKEHITMNAKTWDDLQRIWVTRDKYGNDFDSSIHASKKEVKS